MTGKGGRRHSGEAGGAPRSRLKSRGAQLNVIAGSAVGVSLAEMNWSVRVDIPSSVAVTRRLATAERAPSGINVSTGAGDV
jgi:hypothetical protein